MARSYTKKEKEEKKKLFLEAYEDSKGMTTTSCERAGFSRVTLEKWRKEDPEFDASINGIKAKVQEYVEGQLMTLIRNNVPSAIYFWLKCKGGFRETQKLEVEQVGDIDVKACIEEIRQQITKDGGK